MEGSLVSQSFLSLASSLALREAGQQVFREVWTAGLSPGTCLPIIATAALVCNNVSQACRNCSILKMPIQQNCRGKGIEHPAQSGMMQKCGNMKKYCLSAAPHCWLVLESFTKSPLLQESRRRLLGAELQKNNFFCQP